MTTRDFLVLLVGLFLGGIWTLLRSYLAEKGKNVATKEDLAEITSAVEEIRRESLSALEREKARLQHTQLVNARQYELELEAYRAVWSSLLPVHKAAGALRPMLDYGLVEGETEESRQQARLAEFGNSFNPFTEAVWMHRPFYPAEVFAALDELRRLMYEEAIDYQYMDPREDRREYWTKARANAKAISEQVVQVCETIRHRLSVVRVA